VTLVEGTSFAISSPTGDIEPGGAQGLFFEDTRFVSCWRMRLDESVVEGLGVIQNSPFDATFVTRGHPATGRSDSTLVIVRNRFVGYGMCEEIIVRNLDREPAACTLTFDINADFAHIFDVKEGRVPSLAEPSIEVASSSLVFSYENLDISRRLVVQLPNRAVVKSRRVSIDLVVAARGETRSCFEFCLEMDGEPIAIRHRCGDSPERSDPAARLRTWESHAPRVRSGNPGLDATFEKSIADLGSLRIFDASQPEHVVVAAGAPWFMTLFGRDSLITSLMTLGVDRSLAIGTLLTLARFQGDKVDALTEEEPGRILHEVRSGLPSTASNKTGSIYYGSIDSTPLFVIALGELYRWGLSDDLLRELLPHADRALAWIDVFGDRDGDGFVEYQRATGRGLLNQGWKDSFDGVNFASGRIAEPPVALCEVQGYVYAAFLSRAMLARELGDDETAADYEKRAARLKEAFNAAFWIEERGYYALGLDGEKRQIDSLTSNIGHCLWTGIVDDDKAALVAKHLCGPEMFTGWGIRTLASSMGAFNPVSYHNGSVWPHDSAIVAAGLMRYGFAKEAHAITLGLLTAAEVFGGRLPELLCGFDRSDFALPVRYPTSCSPQAWSSAAPLWLLGTTLLGLDPTASDKEIRLAPNIPQEFGSITVENLPVADTRISISATGSKAIVSGLPDAFSLIGASRSQKSP
jgi:glycogen debranching enzyme